MNTIHVEVTPGVSYTLHCKIGSTPLTAQLYDTAGAPSRSYTIAPGRSAYMTCEYGVLTLESDGECAWRLVPLSLSDTGGGDAQTLKGDPGAPGMSAYAIATQNGFVGSEAEWLESLMGDEGKSAYELAVENGYTGTLAEWLTFIKGEKGDEGKSAYQLATEGGFGGTEEEWIESLKGEPGENGGLSQEDVEALLTSAYEEASLGTPAGTDNATCNYIILDPARVPDGLLTQISYKVGTSTGTGMTTTPLYCAVWELQEGTSSTYNFVGISSNTVTQSINATCTWVFERLPLHGRALKLIPTTDSENTEVASVNLRIRTSGSTDGTLCYNNGSAKRFTPRMDVSYLRAVARFASPTDLNGHVNDAGKHITADERTEWNNTAANLTEHTNDTASHVSTAQASILSAFEWDSVRGISIIHTTDGAVDNRLRVMLSATGANLVTSGSLTLQAAQIGMSTRTAFQAWTDSSTGTSYNYGGHTMSETEMAPYGISEPCVWCGEPSLPLLLRGAEIRINGNVIDVEKLMGLLNKADSILSLVGEETPVS